MNRQVPTLEDVAREAEVSRATVSRVVNGVRNVDPGRQDLDHYAGGRLAGERLLARGCRRVAMIGVPRDLRAGRDRLAGFRDVLARAGHDSPPVVEGAFTLDSGAAAMAGLLDEHVQGGRTEPHTRVFAPELVVRASA
ncbi:LacI family DNA-binding transcriptional regulator [Streptomyces sp. NPDC006134]|uniref:LacI family DNA-binding transcriptional regulator n=1 Tax=Streptomyces sp. NPDC006134 TaxID=3154467 RepID=UPI0033DB0D85